MGIFIKTQKPPPMSPSMPPLCGHGPSLPPLTLPVLPSHPQPYGLSPPPPSTGHVSIAQAGFPPPSLPVTMTPGPPPLQAPPAAVVSPVALAPNSAQLPPHTMPQQPAPVSMTTVHAGTVPAELNFKAGDAPHQVSPSQSLDSPPSRSMPYPPTPYPLPAIPGRF